MFNLYSIKDFGKLTESSQFQMIVKDIVCNTVPWDAWIRKDIADELRHKLKDVKNYNEAYEVLKHYSFPQISPEEENPNSQGQRDRDGLIQCAQCPKQVQWYCYLHNCQVINGKLMFYVMTKLYPDIKWYFYEFVSNIDPNRILTAIL
jgi:hypothetical protein